MGIEINLMSKYPKTKRDIDSRGKSKTEQDRIIARKFDKDFFDGDRRHGYGGYKYNKKFWSPVIPDFINYYSLNNSSSILDIGCGKGFMVYDFKSFLPKANVQGIDISKYAIDNSLPEVSEFLHLGNAKNLPFEDNSFDLVTSIVSIHNLEINDCALAIREINRVSRKYAFITVDAYSNDEERDLMHEWNLTAMTIMSCNEWVEFFKENNYIGDYYWFKP